MTFSKSCGDIFQTRSDAPIDVTQSCFGAWKPYGAVLLAPSDGIGNDAMRAKNFGSRLGGSPLGPSHSQGRLGLKDGDAQKKLGNSLGPSLGLLGMKDGLKDRLISGPKDVDMVPEGWRRLDETPKRQLPRLASLGRLVINTEPSSPAVPTKTPRTMRGSCRQASVLPISTVVLQSRAKRVAAAMNSMNNQDSSEPASPSSPARKRVSFTTDVESPRISEYVDSRSIQGEKKIALKRSKSLMSSLYDLRRASAVAETTNTKDTKDITLMNSTLADLRDNELGLRATERLLVDSHEPITQFGGARFATAIVSQRTLAVVQRKASLLKTAEARANAFDVADARKDDLVAALLESPCPIPDAFVGLKKFTAGLIHKDGNPIDADKSNFELFAASFGLSAKHEIIVQLKSAEAGAVEWWAWRTLAEAQGGASSEGIQRMICVVVSLCGDQRHPALAEVKIILDDRIAENVVLCAEKLQARDAAIVGRTKEPQPASAREAADGIMEELRKAIALGAPGKHPMMDKAKSMEVMMRLEEKNRFAAKALLVAQVSQEEDAKAAKAAAPAVAPVGPATTRADAIEKVVELAISRDGVQESHPLLKDALTIAKQLRDLDGDRKRLAARERRLALMRTAHKAPQIGSM